MLNRRVMLGGVGALLGQALLNGQKSGGSKVVFEHELPDVMLKNWSVTAVEVSYGPGESSAAHRHPGITIVYVLEGEIRSKVGEGPERTYAAGQMFLERPANFTPSPGTPALLSQLSFWPYFLQRRAFGSQPQRKGRAHSWRRRGGRKEAANPAAGRVLQLRFKERRIIA
jgi:hypothetical protein